MQRSIDFASCLRDCSCDFWKSGHNGALYGLELRTSLGHSALQATVEIGIVATSDVAEGAVAVGPGGLPALGRGFNSTCRKVEKRFRKSVAHFHQPVRHVRVSQF